MTVCRYERALRALRVAGVHTSRIGISGASRVYNMRRMGYGSDARCPVSSH